MPTYEYGCPKCGHEFEADQRITDAPLKSCPKCKSRKVKRLISRTSFVLKGGGWYSDLYSSGGAKKSVDAGDSSSSESKSESSKSETKSDSSAETPKPSGDGGASKSKGKSKSESKAKAA